MLGVQDTPNRQVILITDGLPTAHFEGSELFMLYPPDPRTERETMREAMRCKQEGIVINIFLLPSWSQSHEDVQFAHRLARSEHRRHVWAEDLVGRVGVPVASELGHARRMVRPSRLLHVLAAIVAMAVAVGGRRWHSSCPVIRNLWRGR